jgi:FtsH-binding integral membrane protein
MNLGSFNKGSVVLDDKLRLYMRAVFLRMFMALSLTGIVSFICVSSPELLEIMSGGAALFGIVTFGIVIYLSTRINKIQATTANTLFWIYSACQGAFLSPLFALYTSASIANAFFMTAIFFGGMSLYGYTTKKDLTRLGSFMTVGLICIIVTTLVNVFILKNSGLQTGLSALTIIVFCGLTAFDVQKIRGFYSFSDNEETLDKKAIFGALALYLDFINIFLHILRFVGDRK